MLNEVMQRPEQLNDARMQYGKELRSSGIAYGKYADTINAPVARRREHREARTEHRKHAGVSRGPGT
eukprot:12387219-Heterocapsa_arctica.AAC.1